MIRYSSLMNSRHAEQTHHAGLPRRRATGTRAAEGALAEIPLDSRHQGALNTVADMAVVASTASPAVEEYPRELSWHDWQGAHIPVS